MSIRLSDYVAFIEDLVEKALEEDMPRGDITTDSLIPAHTKGRADFIARANGLVAGNEIAAMVFQKVDPFLKYSTFLPDGSPVAPDSVFAAVQGNIGSILRAERTALNFLQHLSGIASATSQYVEAVRGLPVKILDTRKTIPGMRLLEKYAVAVGGGVNHRLNLSEMVLIKDNHIALLRREGIDIAEIIELARGRAPGGMRIEVEAETPEDAFTAAAAGAEIVMLDNMNLDDMRKAVKLVNHAAILEASGGVNLNTVRSIAETGVDWISVGAITHSFRSLDISLELGR